MLDLIAQRYKIRPSEILGIEDDYTAYQLDLVTAIIGKKNDDKEKLAILDDIDRHILFVVKAINPKINIDKLMRRKQVEKSDNPQTLEDWKRKLGG